MPGRDLSAELFGAQTPAPGMGRDLSYDLFGTSPATGVSAVNQIPGIPGAAARMATEAAAVPAPDAPTLLNKIKGVGQAALSLGSGLTTGLVGMAAGGIGGAIGNLTNGKYGNPEGVEKGMLQGADAGTYSPTSTFGKEYAGKVSDAIQNSGVAGLPIGPELGVIGGLARPAAAQIGGSTEAYALGQLGNKMSSASVLPKIEPNRAALLQKALDMGFKITPDMMTNNKFVNILTDTLRKVPLSGSPADTNQAVFNNQIIKAIGGDKMATRLTPDVFSSAMEKSGSTIGDIAAKTDVPFSDSVGATLSNAADNASSFHTDDVAKVVNNYVNQIVGRAGENGGVIDGTFLRRVNSQLSRQARTTTNGDLKSALDGLHDDLLGAMQSQISNPDDLTAFNQARQQYAIGKTVEPLVAKTVDGNISPASLMGRVTTNAAGKTAMAQGNAGPLGDLARIGQVLKDPGSSNTAERGLAYGLLGGGALANPVATTGVFTGANLYNRLSPLLAKRIVGNSLAPSMPPVSFPTSGLELLGESAWPERAAATPAAPPYRGLLSLAEDLPYKTPDTERLATTHDYPTIDFPLRQEVMQQPEISSAIDNFRVESGKLSSVISSSKNEKVRAKAQDDLSSLQQKFLDGMRQLGISNAQDAHGLNRPLYDTGNGTRLPIQSTFNPKGQLP